jgi:DNA-binding transcriptional MerR regulator
MPQIEAHTRNENADQPITTSTFARIAKCAESTVRLWERRGVVRPIARTPTGLRLFARADAERMREQRG